MAFTDHWEIDNGYDAAATEAAIWQLMVGGDTEDPVETKRQTAVILDGIPGGKRALEIGCGVGRLLKAVAADGRFGEVCGVDSSMSMIAAASAHLKERLIGARKIYLDLNDGLNLPYPDNSFEFVFSFTSFQHMISLAIVHRNLREIRRVLIPGGICRVQTVYSGGADPRDLKTYDGRVFRSVEEFAQQFKGVGLKVMGAQDGLTHLKHAWVTAKRDFQC